MQKGMILFKQRKPANGMGLLIKNYALLLESIIAEVVIIVKA